MSEIDLPGDWEGGGGEGNRPITEDSGYYSHWYYNPEQGWAIQIDTAEGVSGKQHVVQMFEATFEEGEDSDINEYAEKTRQFSLRDDEIENHEDAEEAAHEFAEELMERVEAGEF